MVGVCRLDLVEGGAIVVLFYKKVPQLWEISLFRKESAACDGNSRQRFSQLITPIALGVSLSLFVFAFANTDTMQSCRNFNHYFI